MLVHNVEQGSPEWLALRLGIPTASEFYKIITPTGKLSTQYDDYANKLIAELLMNKPVSLEASEWMQRGKELEAEAVKFYELQHDIETEVVGFVTNDEKTLGASPDRIVGDGLLEIKCPAPHNHVSYMINKDIGKKYYPQIQGQLLITEKKWVDIMSYHPEMPPVIVRVERDEEFLKSLQKELNYFLETLNNRKTLVGIK